MIKSHYNRVFDFGCSFTCYRWLSWSDIIGLNTEADIVHKHSSSGSGIKHLYFNLQNVCKNQNLGATDLVLIQIPNLCRMEKIMHRSWTNMGDFELEYRSFSEIYFPEDLYGSEIKFYVLDHFAETMMYLEMIRMIIMSLPCDVEIIQTDEFDCDLEARLYSDPRQKLLEFSKDYDPEWCPANHNLFIDSITKIIDDYRDTTEYFKKRANYRSYIDSWIKSGDQNTEIDKMNWRHDPHPSISCSLDFVTHVFDIDITPKCQSILDKHITEWRHNIQNFLNDDNLSNQHIHEAYRHMPFKEYEKFMNSDQYLYHIWPF